MGCWVRYLGSLSC